MNKGVATQVIHNPWGFFSLLTPSNNSWNNGVRTFRWRDEIKSIICQVGLPKKTEKNRGFGKKRTKKKPKNLASYLLIEKTSSTLIWYKVSWSEFVRSNPPCCINESPGRPLLVGLEPFKHLELWVVLERGLRLEPGDFLTENHHSSFLLGHVTGRSQNEGSENADCKSSKKTGVKISHSQQIHCYKSPPVWTKGCITSEFIPWHETFCNLQFLRVGHSAPNSAITQI